MASNGVAQEEAKELWTAGGKEKMLALWRLVGQAEPPGFGIYVQADEHDDITSAILSSRYSFPPGYALLTALASPGGRVLDLGGHIGSFSLYACARGFDVITVEPSPRNAALLQASMHENRFDRFQLVRGAVSDRLGELQFVEAGPYGVVANPSVEEPGIAVPATTVDLLLAEHGWGSVDFIKMDIEGSEVSALGGMSELLARPDAPPILYESNGYTLAMFGQTPESLMATLESFGYTCYLVDAGELTLSHSSDLQPECNMDYLAIKAPLPLLPGWQVGPAMTRDERITRLFRSCMDPNVAVQSYLRAAMDRVDERLRADWRVAVFREIMRLIPTVEAGSVTEGLQYAVNADTAAGLARIFGEMGRLTDEAHARDEEIARLRALVSAYEQGRFMRAMRELHRLRGVIGL